MRPLIAAALLLLGSTAIAQSGGDAALDALLEQVPAEARAQGSTLREREQAFLARRDEQRALLRQARAQVAERQRAVDALRGQIRELGETLEERQATLKERSGDLEGVAAVLRDAATETREAFSGSLVTLQAPERLDTLTDLTRVSDVPAASELESLWLLLQQEATALAATQTLRTLAADAQGELAERELRRYGGFALRTPEGDYLRWRGGGAAPEIIARQPEPGLVERAAGSAGDGLIVDPTGGLLLGLQESRPDLRARIAQAGIIGLIILALGALGLLLGLIQLVYLVLVGGRVRRQLKDPARPRPNNPLGRVLRVGQERAGQDFESLELAADEAVMREVPRLERLQDSVRLIAAVAPLLGLLGTVTGMIETFQAITLFGTGDPKLMAGGISQALMTTVLGLVVAVPLLFLHSLIVARSRAIVQRLDQQSAGLLARIREGRAEALA